MVALATDVQLSLVFPSIRSCPQSQRSSFLLSSAVAPLSHSGLADRPLSSSFRSDVGWSALLIRTHSPYFFLRSSCMTAVSVPFDYLPLNHSLSRSNSFSSSSPSSRPHSSQGLGPRLPSGMSTPAEDPYRLSYLPADPVRHSSAAYSISHTDLVTIQASPSTHPANTSLKGHIRQTHLRARAAASPYPRDTESVHSSSSETDDISMYLGSSSDYPTAIYGHGQPMSTNHQDAIHTTGAFGRMSISPDHGLEKLAANVRVATTTSASDRAKQIFVQAW